MARNIQHKDLFYRKPPPTYKGSQKGSQKKRPKKRKRSKLPFLLLVAAAAGVIAFSMRDRGEIKKEESQTESGLEFEVVSNIEETESVQKESSQAPRNYDNMLPAAERDISNAQTDYFNTMMIVDKAGYRYFKFSEENSIDFINLIKRTKNNISSSVNFYTMILPDATDIMLPQTFLADVPQTSDQQKALDYLNASINAVAPGVRTINPYEILKANCDQDIFFKLDRNWTALGAYYGYRMYANSIGLKPIALTDFEENTYEGFRGSMYGQSNENSLLDYTEDIVTYTPSAKIKAAYNQSGSMVETPLVTDPASYNTDQKYSAFLGGNYAYMEITNEDIKDGSSLIVVKDAMGNAMIPFLACHYHTIYVVDYQNYQMSIPGLVSSTGAKNLLFMCRISATSESYDISLMQEIM